MRSFKQIWRDVSDFCNQYVSVSILGIYLVGISIMYVMMAAHVPTQNGDNIEHIHSSFLIAQGLVPYRDFFQHHNPLLWYLFAPLVQMFAYNATITEIVCLISFLFFLKSLVYVYRINAEFLSNKLWGLVAAVAVAAPGYKLYALDFRPDNYMIFCLTGGIYYYFRYLKYQKTGQLVVAFAWFIIAFFFAQKALFPLAVLGLSGLYFWYKGAIKTTDMARAMIFPLLALAGFVLYLAYYDMVGLYYDSNYTFNLNLERGFDVGRVVEVPIYILIWACIAFGGAAVAVWQKKRYWGVIALLFVSEFVQRKFYFSPYSYYYWLLAYLAIMCGIPLLAKIYVRFRAVIWLVIAGLYITVYNVFGFQRALIVSQGERKYLPDYIARSINPCDYVFNGDGTMYNLFGKDPAYYWQLIGQLDVIGEQTGIYPKPDINALILRLKPKFVYGKSYFNKFSDEARKPEVVHYVDRDIINTYYNPTQFGTIYKLKPEFDKRKCVKNETTGQWYYVEEE